jgi:hypothetical protein
MVAHSPARNSPFSPFDLLCCFAQGCCLLAVQLDAGLELTVNERYVEGYELLCGSNWVFPLLWSWVGSSGSPLLQDSWNLRSWSLYLGC